MEVTYKLSNQHELTLSDDIAPEKFTLKDSGGYPMELTCAEMENICRIFKQFRED